MASEKDTVERYLSKHPEYLQEYITKNLPVSSQIDLAHQILALTDKSENLGGSQFLRPSTTTNQSDTDKLIIPLWELAFQVMQLADGDGFHLYLSDSNGEFLYLVLPDERSESRDSNLTNGEATATSSPVAKFRMQQICDINTGKFIAALVARTNQIFRMDDWRLQMLADDPSNVLHVGCNPEETEAVLVVPVVFNNKSPGADYNMRFSVGRGDSPIFPLSKSAQVVGVVELFRFPGGVRGPFSQKDEDIAVHCVSLGSAALHDGLRLQELNMQTQLNSYLLNIVKSIFQDIVSMDAVIMKIMNHAQRLVNADRASLFLVDSRTHELYARIFDIGTEEVAIGEASAAAPNKTAALSSGLTRPNLSKEIRFPIGKGIAGSVAATGAVLNIQNAYEDERFNPEVDQRTGYKTKSILCMPIFIRGSVIGVVQMVNKQMGAFTKADEEAFETFAIYCGLALHHAKLYDKIRRSEQKYKVALDVLAYHSTCTEDEFNMLKSATLPDEIPDIDRFEFSPWKLTEFQKPLCVIYMFRDLFGLTRFDLDTLIKFSLTVRKNYRKVPYHNYTHGFSVANSMYVTLKANAHVFKPLEALALYVAALCHDLDHRGKNNQFMVKFSSPLAAIYTTSTMEHHHFNQTVAILQQEGHNIFRSLTPQEYREVLGNIKHCILATDLALFFPNKNTVKGILERNEFDWKNPEHRMKLQAIVMTGCDLSAATKPWEIQQQTVKTIMEEFYEQGDQERVRGAEPIPMLDRKRANELPANQIGFINGICLPCYELMVKLLPGTQPMYDGAKYNLEMWQKEKDKVDAAAPAST
ncbi:hypothetical protein RvY_18464 [Ramazzottius varieornatus]|uniref:Phosphodiesterase n=1 Tax=Ramazzottius varieornatus TaxID=947166 RepID=A0A1D1W945_RAMVA|nr:hypothetical protein RvY_18464 [Ramazzottius varieornatus]